MDSDAVFEKVDRILGGRLKASNKLGAQAEPNGTVAPGPKKPNSAKTPGAAGASTSASGSAKDSAPLPAEGGSLGPTAVVVGDSTAPQLTVSDPDVEDAAAVEGEQEKKVWIPELKRLIQVKDARSPTPQVIPEESFKRRRKRVAKDPDGPYKDYAMLSRKILGPGGREYRIEIQSQGLRKIFQDIGRPYRELDLDASPILIRYPFQCLFFLRDRIRELSTDETVATDTRQELEELLNFIASEPVLQNVIKLYDDSVPRGKIPRSILWTLYRPHDWIYMRETVNPWTDHESEYFAVVSRVEAKVEANTGIKTHKVYFVVGFHDGRKFDLRERWFWVDPLPNEVLDISTDALRLIPLRFIPTEERDAIRSRLLARGKKYISLSTRPVTFMQYKGPITIADDANSKLLGPIGSGHEGIHSNWEVG